MACGRLKSAFQVATQANNETDVQYVFHEVRVLRLKPDLICLECRSISQCIPFFGSFIPNSVPQGNEADEGKGKMRLVLAKDFMRDSIF